MRIKNFFKKIFFSNITVYIVSIIGAILGFFLNVLLSRSISLEELDKIKYLLALINTLSVILVVGLPSFILRETKKNDLQQNKILVSKCLTIYFTFFLFIFPIAYYILANNLAYTKEDSALTFIVILCSVLLGLISIIVAFLQGRRKFCFSHIVETILPKGILLVFILFCFIFNKKDIIPDNYLLVYLALYSIICIVFLIKEFRGISIDFTKKDLVTLFFIYISSVAQILSAMLSTVLQSNFFPEIVGVTSTISTGSLLMASVTVFTNVVNTLIKPAYAFHYKQNRKDLVCETFEFGTRTNLYFAIPVYLFLIIFPMKFLQIFGTNLTKYPLIISILAATNLFSSIGGTTGALLYMTGNERKMFINSILHFICYVILIFVFRSNKIYGLVLCSLGAEIFVVLIKCIQTWKYLKRLPYSKSTIFSTLQILVMDALIIVCFSFLKINNLILWFAIAILLGCFILFLNIITTKNGINDFKKLLHFKE